jgi:hypothetical protein
MKHFLQRRAVGKTLAFWGVFMLLYFVYKYFPSPVLALIAGTTESCFQHFKAGFFSYLIVNLIAYAIRYRQITNRDSFIYARLLTTIFLPWIIFLLWYIAPAVVGPLPNNTYEIIYANLIIILVGVCTVTLESSLETATYQKPQKAVLISLFFVSILLYIAFTYQLPWADVFVEPDWR